MSRVLSFCKSFFSSSTKKNTNLEDKRSDTSNEGEEPEKTRETSNFNDCESLYLSSDDEMCPQKPFHRDDPDEDDEMCLGYHPDLPLTVDNDHPSNVTKESHVNVTKESRDNNSNDDDENLDLPLDHVPPVQRNEGEERWKSFCETLSSSSSTYSKKRTYSSRNSEDDEDDDDDENRSKKKHCPVVEGDFNIKNPFEYVESSSDSPPNLLGGISRNLEIHKPFHDWLHIQLPYNLFIHKFLDAVDKVNIFHKNNLA
jgi:hypothetical protein